MRTTIAEFIRFLQSDQYHTDRYHSDLLVGEKKLKEMIEGINAIQSISPFIFFIPEEGGIKLQSLNKNASITVNNIAVGSDDSNDNKAVIIDSKLLKDILAIHKKQKKSVTFGIIGIKEKLEITNDSGCYCLHNKKDIYDSKKDIYNYESRPKIEQSILVDKSLVVSVQNALKIKPKTIAFSFDSSSIVLTAGNNNMYFQEVVIASSNTANVATSNIATPVVNSMSAKMLCTFMKKSDSKTMSLAIGTIENKPVWIASTENRSITMPRSPIEGGKPASNVTKSVKNIIAVAIGANSASSLKQQLCSSENIAISGYKSDIAQKGMPKEKGEIHLSSHDDFVSIHYRAYAKQDATTQEAEAIIKTKLKSKSDFESSWIDKDSWMQALSTIDDVVDIFIAEDGVMINNCFICFKEEKKTEWTIEQHQQSVTRVNQKKDPTDQLISKVCSMPDSKFCPIVGLGLSDTDIETAHNMRIAIRKWIQSNNINTEDPVQCIKDWLALSSK